MPHYYDTVLQERIWLTDEELRVINLPEFQRLKYIKQNGFSYVKYPDAINTRYDHSIGTLHWATKLYQSIFPDKSIIIAENIELRAIRLAALLHDIGHGPFSHVLESLLERNEDWLNLNPWKGLREKYNKEKPHELITLNIINNKISKILNKDVLEKILKILTNKDELSIIISGDLDADRLDYLTRDSHYSGLPFGFNVKVIFNEILEQNISIKKMKSKYFLCIKSDGISAFEQFLVARYAHYKYIAYEPKILKTNLRFITAIEKSLENKIKLKSKINKILYYIYTNVKDDELLHLSFEVPKGRLKDDMKLFISDNELKNTLLNLNFENRINSTNIKLVKLDKMIAYNLIKEKYYGIRSAEKIFKRDLGSNVNILPYLPSSLALKTCVDDIDVNKKYNPLFLYDYSPILQGLEQKMYLDCGILFLHDKKIKEKTLLNEFNTLIRMISDFDIITYALIEFLSRIYKKYSEEEAYYKVKRTKIIKFITQLSKKLYDKKLLENYITTEIKFYSEEIYNILQKLEYLDIINEDFNVIHSKGFIPTYVYSKGEFANNIMREIKIPKKDVTIIEMVVEELMPKDKSWWEI